MNARGTAGRLLVGLVVVGLVGGCASGGSPTPGPATGAPAGLPSAAIATPTPTSPPTRDIAYESANPVLTPGELDVYAPAKAGPWPVVVMFHGGGGYKGALSQHARKVADLGFVVFSATWGAGRQDPAPTYEEGLAIQSQAACAVEFARTHAADYGGNPATMILFGHSAGANTGAMVAFARPAPTAGCLGGATLGAIDALVTWEGDWVLQTTFMGWDRLLAADPRVMTALTPSSYLAEHKDLRVVMLVSEHPYSEYDLDRPLPDAKATDAFFASRDPSGVLRAQLEANGALADGILDVGEAQELLFSLLDAQGNLVSLDVMPGSTHIHLSKAGWKVFLAAFPKAAADD
jgi:acetyl esterase/lipase